MNPEDVPAPVRAFARAWYAWQDEPGFPLRPDHCINGTRTAIQALAQFGVKAGPVSVRFLLLNRQAAELIEAQIPMDRWPDLAWSIASDEGPQTRPGHWPGHLVVAGDGWTLDPSSRAFHRPGLLVVSELFLFPELPRDEPLVMTDERGQVLSVIRTPANNAWRQSSGWKVPRPAIVAEVVDRMTRLL